MYKKPCQQVQATAHETIRPCRFRGHQRNNVYLEYDINRLIAMHCYDEDCKNLQEGKKYLTMDMDSDEMINLDLKHWPTH
jgi:hypothetical protein